MTFDIVLMYCMSLILAASYVKHTLLFNRIPNITYKIYPEKRAMTHLKIL